MSNRRLRLKNQSNMVKVNHIKVFSHSTGITLERAKSLLSKGYTTEYIMSKYNILSDDKISLYKHEEELNKININQQLISTIDNKPHELSFITRKNEYQESLLDSISREIQGIFGNKQELYNFAISTR